MKNNLFYLTSVFIAFLVGVFLTYIVMTKQQMDKVLKTSANIAESSILKNAEDKEIFPVIKESAVNTKENTVTTITTDSEVEDLINNKDNLTLNDYSQEQASQLVEDMPNFVLEQYINKFMANGTSDVLTDKRRFAQRAIEEIYNQNDSQRLLGEVKISYSEAMPEVSVNTTSIDMKTKIYAHLDTKGKIPQSKYVFVKWVNNTTGQILLFEKKDIVADRNQNWVSFIPDDSWQVGDYDIRFYQFTSELEPIAQTSYQIHEIKEGESATVSQTSTVLLKSEDK